MAQIVFYVTWRGELSRPTVDNFSGDRAEEKARERYNKVCRDPKVLAARLSYRVPHCPVAVVAEFGTRFAPLPDASKV